MELAPYLELRRLHQTARLMQYVMRKTNPVTGAQIPQPQQPLCPPAPSVI